jgi:hypothetical protein
MPKRGSCGNVLPGCRLSKQYPSIDSQTARCRTSRARRDAHCTLLGSPVCRDTRRLVLASRLPSRTAPTCDPHSARCSAGCPTSRDFVPWRFLDAGQLSVRSLLVAGVQKPTRERLASGSAMRIASTVILSESAVDRSPGINSVFSGWLPKPSHSRPPRCLRKERPSAAALTSPTDEVHAALARSTFEVVSATNLRPINDRAEPSASA